MTNQQPYSVQQQPPPSASDRKECEFRQCRRLATDHFRGHDYCWQHVRIEQANRQDWDIPL